MNEWNLVWLVLPRLLIISIFVMCYVIGGRQWKPLRRIVGGIFLGASVALLSLYTGTHKWWYWFACVGYPIALSLGYGGNTTLVKLFRRLLYGVVLGSVSFIYGNWVLAIFQTIIAALSSIYLGLSNPVQAVNEEAMIALICVSTVVFMV